MRSLLRPLLVVWTLLIFAGVRLNAQMPGVRCVSTIGNQYWVGTETGGIYRLMSDTAAPVSINVAGLPSKINDIAAGRDSVVYVATDKGLYFIKSGTIIQHYDRGNGIASDKVTSLAVSDDGTLWFGTDRGVASLLQTTYRFYNREAGLLDDETTDLCLDNTGRVWALSDDGVSVIAPSGIRKYNVRDAVSLAIDASGRGLVGAKDGLKIIENDVYAVNQMTDQTFVDIHVDAIGKIWVTTLTGNIVQVEENEGKFILRDVSANFPLNGSKAVLIRSNFLGEKTVFTTGSAVFRPHTEADSDYRDHILRLARENAWLGRWTQTNVLLRNALTTFQSVNDSVQILALYTLSLGRAGLFDEAVNTADRAMASSPAERADSIAQTEATMTAGEILFARKSQACVRYFERVVQSTGRRETIEAAYGRLDDYYDSTSNASQRVRWLEAFAGRFKDSPRYWAAKARLADIYAKTDSSKYRVLAREIAAECTDLDVLYRFDQAYDSHRFDRLVERYRKLAENFPAAEVVPVSDSILCSILQGESLWVGTTTGLLKVVMRADSAAGVLRYTTDSGLVDNQINDLSLDRQGRLWVSCGQTNDKGRDVGGLSVYDGKKWISYGVNNGIRGGKVLSTSVSEDKIAVSTPAGVFVAKNNAYPYWTAYRKAGNRDPSKLHIDNLGRLWLVAKDIFVETNNDFDVVKIENPDTTNDTVLKPSRFFVDDVGNKLVFSGDGVYKYDGSKFSLLFRSSDSTARVTAFGVDVRGSVLLGAENGFSKHTDLAVINFDVNDSLPSNRILDIVFRPSDKLIVTTRGIYRYTESPRDTVKMLQNVRKTVDEWITEKNYQRLRQVCRQLARVSPLADYFTYELARSFEHEGKFLESLNYLTEYVKLYGKTENINEVAFYRVAVGLENDGDLERADVVLRAMMRGFSSGAAQTLVRLDDEALSSFKLNWSLEKNPFLLSVYRHYLNRAGKHQQEKQFNLALGDYKTLVSMYSEAPFISARDKMLQLADNASESDRGFRIKTLNQVLKQGIAGDRQMDLLFELARTFHESEQYREAAARYEEILNLRRLTRLEDEIRLYWNETKKRAELGLKSGSGYSEVNSTNAMDFEGNYLWLGTSKGVIRWSLADGSYRKYTAQDGLITDYIYDLAIDSSGGKWFVGTSLGYNDDRGGVSFFDGEAFVNFTKTEGLASNKVRCVTIDRKGVAWVGTDEGVSAWKDGKWTNYDLRKKLDFSYVSALATDKLGRLWVGLATRSQFPSTTGGALIFDENNPTVFTTKTGLSSNNVKSIRVDESQHVWFSTTEGVSIYSTNDKSWKYITADQKLASNVVRGVEFSHDQIWFATDRGLSMIPAESPTRGLEAVADKTAIRSFTEKEGLVTNDIRLIRYHPEFGTWVGSKRGSFSVGNFAGVESEEASQSYNRKLFEVSVESEAIFEKAQQFIEQGDFDKAREIYLDVLDRVANSEWSDDAEFLLAKSYELEGNYEEAEKKYAAFVANNPESDLVASAYIGMGNVFEKQKKFERAEEAFKQAESKSIDKSIAEQARILGEKVKVRKIASERAATESMAQSLSQKYTELDKQTGEARTKLLAEIEALEKKVGESAKAGGFDLKLYKVKEGESLWYLSQKFLGDPTKWRDFFIANEGKVTDPDLIVAGQTIVVLTLEKGAKEKLDKFVYYDVSPGEDLETIASKLYGSKDKWRLIYEANKEKVTDSPKRSLGKMRLLIPVED